MNNRMKGALVALLVVAAGSASADEGMWTLDHLPVQQLQQRYNFTPTPQWIDLVQHASLRLAEGCSGSFISANGLVMTNHHCANTCLSQLSKGGNNYMQHGYAAKDEKDERKCPDMELNQLERITDVTARVNTATQDKNGAARIKAERAVNSAIEQECVGGDADKWRCDVITLYHGGRYALYKYRRYQDVRLVFAPEQSIAFFGGDLDNFNFPRYDLDMTFFRAYVDGKPAQTPQYFKFDPAGPKAGELTFVVGNPGSSERKVVWTALRDRRDEILIPFFGYLSESRGQLWQYSRMGAQQKQEAQEALFGADSSLKLYKGWLETLDNPKFVAKKEQDDAALRQWITTDPARVKKYGDPFTALEKAQQRGAQLRERYDMINGRRGFGGQLFTDATILVHGAIQREKPNAERPVTYRNANLPVLEQRLKSDAPAYPQYEETRLAWTLEKMQQVLGPENPVVRDVLGNKSPSERAHELVSGTKLADPALREKLWQGGEKAIDASSDPMIVLARRIEPAATTLSKEYEDQVEAPAKKAEETIAQARFARNGTSGYPDATFTLRLSFGKVKGWMEKGQQVEPFTHFAGLYKRATGSDPFKLPQSWLDAKSSLDMDTPMDFVTDNDIIGGNSGSPVINRKGHAVGLIFDGNIESIGGNFTFDDSVNRSVAVDTSAIDAALRKVYKLPKLADELANGHR